MTIAQQTRYRRSLQKTIARHSAVPNRGVIANAQLERERERYLSSHAVQSIALLDGWRRILKVPEATQRWAEAQQVPICAYDYRRFRSAPLSFFHKPRSTGGVRKICRIGDIERMWHVMARDLVVAQHRPRPHIGDWLGRGRDWQIDQIRSVLTSPRQAVVSADIVKAFASVNVAAVYDLPYLPEPLIRRVIDSRSHRFVRRERSEYAYEVHKVACNDHDGALERSPSGLLEGSPTSNAVFSVLMDDLPDQLGEGIHAFVYCDNIILIAPSMLRALQARDALARYLAGHRAGPFEIRSTVTTARVHFEHLGYSIQQRDGSPPEIGLSISGSNKLGARIDNQDVSLEETMTWLRASYGSCSRELMDTYVQRVVDEVGFRSRATA